MDEVSGQASAVAAAVAERFTGEVFPTSELPPLRGKIVVDTDLGTDVDDALALLYMLNALAAADRAADLVGVTTVYGHVGLRSRIAELMCTSAGYPFCFTVGGGDCPLRTSYPHIFHTHHEGENILPEAERSALLARDRAQLRDFVDRGGARPPAGAVDESLTDHSAARWLASVCDGDTVVVCIGALTNLYLALKHYDAQIGHVVMLANGINRYPPDQDIPRFRGKRSNPSPLQYGHTYLHKASHNVRCDVYAAQAVFNCFPDLQIMNVSTEVTHQLWISGGPLDSLLRAAETAPESSLGIVAIQMADWLKHREILLGDNVGTCPHDTVCTAVAVGQDHCQWVRGQFIMSNTGHSHFIPDPNGNHYVASDIEGEAFMLHICQVLGITGQEE